MNTILPRNQIRTQSRYKWLCIKWKENYITFRSLHYFRLMKEQWKERLLQFKAAGLNTVCFINMDLKSYNDCKLTLTFWIQVQSITHGIFTKKFRDILHFQTGRLALAEFLQAVKDADMFAIYRIGPYMCGEWDLGGYPRGCSGIHTWNCGPIISHTWQLLEIISTKY